MHLVLLRHGERQDRRLVPTFDPGLLELGHAQAAACLPACPSPVVFHTLPYKRCLETCFDAATSETRIRIDLALSEWLHPNTRYTPPLDPETDLGFHVSRFPNLITTTGGVMVDVSWDRRQLGGFNGVGLTYREYRERLHTYLTRLVDHYGEFEGTVVVVTHGAAVHALLQCLAQRPIFSEIPEAQASVAVGSGREWRVVLNCIGVVPSERSNLELPREYVTTFEEGGVPRVPRTGSDTEMGKAAAVDTRPRLQSVAVAPAPAPAPSPTAVPSSPDATTPPRQFVFSWERGAAAAAREPGRSPTTRSAPTAASTHAWFGLNR